MIVVDEYQIFKVIGDYFFEKVKVYDKEKREYTFQENCIMLNKIEKLLENTNKHVSSVVIKKFAVCNCFCEEYYKAIRTHLSCFWGNLDEENYDKLLKQIDNLKIECDVRKKVTLSAATKYNMAKLFREPIDVIRHNDIIMIQLAAQESVILVEKRIKEALGILCYIYVVVSLFVEKLKIGNSDACEDDLNKTKEVATSFTNLLQRMFLEEQNAVWDREDAMEKLCSKATYYDLEIALNLYEPKNVDTHVTKEAISNILRKVYEVSKYIANETSELGYDARSIMESVFELHNNALVKENLAKEVSVENVSVAAEVSDNDDTYSETNTSNDATEYLEKEESAESTSVVAEVSDIVDTYSETNTSNVVNEESVANAVEVSDNVATHSETSVNNVVKVESVESTSAVAEVSANVDTHSETSTSNVAEVAVNDITGTKANEITGEIKINEDDKKDSDSAAPVLL